MAARTDGHLLPFMENLDHAFRGFDLHRLVDQDVRDTVEVLFKGDVVVDIHSGGFPGGKLEGLLW
jgi:hypothetical protein